MKYWARLRDVCFFILLQGLIIIPEVEAAYYSYTLSWLTPNTHTYIIELKVKPQTDSYTDFALPTWRPGRYYLQDYAGAVSHVEAEDENGQNLIWNKINQHTWRVSHGDVDEVVIRYHYFANNRDAGSSYFGEDEIYMNPVNLFMYVPGGYEEDVELHIPNLPGSWKVATALTQQNQRTYVAGSYHEFADSPTVFSPRIEQFSFTVDETTFFVHFQGEYQGTAKTKDAVITALTKLCKEQMAVFGGFPTDEYHFIYRLLPYRMRHAVEHSKSASFALPFNITSTPEKTVNGIISISSHELWHVWNVKRIRPAALWPYDYSGPQFTSLHWFTEGVTSYYTHLTLLRAGIYSEEQFLQQQSNTIESLKNNYAATVVSPSAASYNSWLDVSPYAHPDHQISYYTLGHRAGLLLDLSIRKQTKGAKSLDDVFRYLYQTYYLQGKGVPEDGIQAAVEAVTGDSWQIYFDKYIYGTESLDYSALFETFGLELSIDPPKLGQRTLGIIRTEEISQGLLVRKVQTGSDAYVGGLGENDLILEVDGVKIDKLDLNEYVKQLKPGATVQLRVVSNLAIKELNLVYKQAFAPQNVQLRRKGKSRKQQNLLYQGWIQSQQ